MKKLLFKDYLNNITEKMQKWAKIGNKIFYFVISYYDIIN